MGEEKKVTSVWSLEVSTKSSEKQGWKQVTSAMASLELWTNVEEKTDLCFVSGLFP